MVVVSIPIPQPHIIMILLFWSIIWFVIFFLFGAPVFRCNNSNDVSLTLICCVIFGVNFYFLEHIKYRFSCVFGLLWVIFFTPIYLLDWNKWYQIWPYPTLFSMTCGVGVSLFIMIFPSTSKFQKRICSLGPNI